MSTKDGVQQRGTRIEKNNDATDMLKLCLLIDRFNIQDLKTSLSCLHRHPEVSVTLIDRSGKHTARSLKSAVGEQYRDRADFVRLSGSSVFGKDHEPDEPLSYWIFLPAGDWLSDDALSKISDIGKKTQPDVIYTDQDFIDENGHLCEPQFKPDAAYEYFLHCDYLGALFCIKQSTLANLGGIDLYHYHAERYRLLLQLFSKQFRIEHLAEPIYHAQDPATQIPRPETITSLLEQNFESGDHKVAVKHIEPNVYRLQCEIKGDPKISIIIPFRDKPDLLKQCIDAVISKTDYSNYEIIGISNRSQSLSVYEIMGELSDRDPRVRFVEHNIRFNFSALVNYGVTVATGEYIVLMNNDVTVINSDWLSAMLEHGQRKEIGVVGAKLLYPHGTIQHAGLSIQQSGYIAHLHKHHPAESKGYMNRLICVQNVSAVTGALCLFKTSLHKKLNGFDEDRFKIAFNDVDFCLRAEAMGYSNLFTPYARAYHYESLSRGYENTSERKQRFEQEKKNFAELYQQRLDRSDRFYNPNLNQNRDDFSY